MSRTPGPWEVKYGTSVDAVSGHVVAMRPEQLTGGDKHAWKYAASYEEQKANAHLIAAAPDLLAVAEELLALVEEFIECGFVGDPRNPEASMNGEDLQRARAAIAKARGEA